MTRILGIETSCDETAASVVEDGRRLLSSAVASQIDLHAQYGGIFPEMASRAHIESIAGIVQTALEEAETGPGDLDAVAVTRGPGLPGSLVVGVNYAKGLALASGLPLIGINHLEGHIYSLWLTDNADQIAFPALALLVSGGHTELILMRDHLTYERLGGTLDDAAGEAFDKVARMLDLGYPGGPAIQRAAEEGDPEAVDFPRAMLTRGYDFSFSGLKTAVLRELDPANYGPTYQPDPDEDYEPPPAPDIAASFQAAVVDVLVAKTVKAADAFGAEVILMAGGVSANGPLRVAMAERSERPVFFPPIRLCTDNAAMIAAAGYFRFDAGHRDGLDMDVRPMWGLEELSKS